MSDLVFKVLNFLKQNKIICLLSLILIILLVIFFKFKQPKPVINNKEYILNLFGNTNLNIKIGESYQEPGYYAYYGALNVTNQVIITGTVDNTKAGVYKLIYQIGNQTKERIITVLEVEDKKENDNKEDKNDNNDNDNNTIKEEITFNLLGDTQLTIMQGETYQELGFIAKANQKNINQYVTINNQVNNKKEGTYYIVYTLKYNNEIKQLSRKVIVKSPLLIYIQGNTSSYSKEKKLSIYVYGTDFSYLKLPNQQVIKQRTATYTISNNGTYNFLAYDTSGNYIQETINVNYIDNLVDEASCTLNTKIKSSNITVLAKDNKSGIAYYVYDDKKYLTNQIDLASRIKQASVVVYDKVGNYKSINCQVNNQEELAGFILIGDSRFVAMETHLGDNKRQQDLIVAKGGEGWDWFKKTAISKVNSILKENPDKRYYIFCNLGVNDFKYHLDDANYVKKLNELAKTTWSNHIVGYISVNPYASLSDKRNKTVEQFNARQKGDISGIYYCDTYNGIGLANFEPRKSSDTTHFNKKTSLNIYNYIINNCAF